MKQSIATECSGLPTTLCTGPPLRVADNRDSLYRSGTHRQNQFSGMAKQYKLFSGQYNCEYNASVFDKPWNFSIFFLQLDLWRHSDPPENLPTFVRDALSPIHFCCRRPIILLQRGIRQGSLMSLQYHTITIGQITRFTDIRIWSQVSSIGMSDTNHGSNNCQVVAVVL